MKFKFIINIVHKLILIKKLNPKITPVFFLILFISESQNPLKSQKYQNDFEKITIDSYLPVKGQLNIDVLLTLDPTMSKEKADSIKSIIQNFITELEPEKLKTKPLKSIAKKVFTETHDRFFKKYEILASFDDIFNYKQYNCVSATALYAIIFNTLDIKYELIWQPGHVYLIIFDGKERIEIESTDPVNGYKSKGGEKKYKTDYINQMNIMKMIDLSEFNGKSKEEIYDLMFVEKKSISFNALAAFQYQNKAIEFIGEQKFEVALNRLKIAKELYDDETTRNILNLTYYASILLLQQKNDDSFKLLRYFEEYVTINDSVPEELQHAIFTDLCKLSYIIAIEKSSPDTLLVYYNRLKKTCLNKYPEFKNLSKCVNEEIARYYILKKEYEKSLPYLIPTYAAEQTNLIYSTTLFETYSIFMENLDLPDPEIISEDQEPDYYLNQLRAVIDSSCLKCDCCNEINDMLNYHYELMAISQYCYSNQVEKALKHLELVQSLQKKINFQSANKFLFGQAYKELWAYYTRKQNYETGNIYLDEGLKIDPSNNVLKSINKIVVHSNKK
jgi:hypothetical protein